MSVIFGKPTHGKKDRNLRNISVIILLLCHLSFHNIYSHAYYISLLLKKAFPYGAVRACNNKSDIILPIIC